MTDIMPAHSVDAQVVAREIDALRAERDAALSRERALIEVMDITNRSPGDPQPVFEAVLAAVVRLSGSAFGFLMRYDGERVGVVAACGVALPEMTWFQVDPGTLLHRIVLGEDIASLADITDDDAYRAGVPTRVLMADTYGARSQLIAALRKEGRLLGFINIFRAEVRPFTEQQLGMVRAFAAHAVIAMENARLVNELSATTEALAQRNNEYGERIEHQSATIDVLKAMSASPGNTQPVFDLIVRHALRACNGMSAALFEYDGELVHSRADCGGDVEAIRAFRSMFPKPPTRDYLVGRALLDRQAIHIRDIDTEPGLLPAVRAMGGKTTISVPLLRDGAAIGAISMNAKEKGGFSDSQVALLQTFAEQAVIAIASAGTYRALQERTDALARSVGELQALEEVLRAVNSSLDLDTVLATIISRAVQLSEADQGTIYEFDAAEQVFVPKSAYGMTANRIEALRDRRIRIGETPLGISAAERAPLHIPDLSRTLNIDGSRELLESGMHALLAVPLLREDKVIGGLVIRRAAIGGFAPAILTLLQTFAGQCVLAIENARLFQEARQARTTAERTLADLRRAQDRLVQSEKMASLGQLTAGIAHEIKNPLNFVNNFSDLSRDLLDELRDAIEANHPAEVAELSATLKGNLEKIAQHGRRADSIVKNMLLHSRSGPSEHRPIDLNATVEEALNLAYHGARAETPGFNITLKKDLDDRAGLVELFPQEFIRVMVNLINNGFYATRKRAAEPGFEPTLWLATRDLGDQVEIRVRDNGTGITDAVRDRIFEPFFTTKPAGAGTGLGLSLSYDIVVKQHGGQLSVDSRINEFTEFVITLPRTMVANEGARI